MPDLAHPLLAGHDLRNGVAQLVVLLGLHGRFENGRQHALLRAAYRIHGLRSHARLARNGFKRHVGVTLFLHKLHGGRNNARLGYIRLFLSAGGMIGSRLLDRLFGCVFCGFSGHGGILNILNRIK